MHNELDKYLRLMTAEVADPMGEFWNTVDLEELTSSLVYPSGPIWCLENPSCGSTVLNDDRAQRSPKVLSQINSKGKRKSDHELREEFYRTEFRRLTGGLKPPAFTPSRSAHSESFVWRPRVNEQYGINIPLYRRINGQLDRESSPRVSPKFPELKVNNLYNHDSLVSILHSIGVKL
jgi:hypothetical protein